MATEDSDLWQALLAVTGDQVATEADYEHGGGSLRPQQGQLAKAAPGVACAGHRRQLGRQLAAVEEPDREEVDLELGEPGLRHLDVHLRRHGG